MSACVLDTDVVIAALDRSDPHHRASVEALLAMMETSTSLLLSLVNYAEALVRPAEDEKTLRAAVAAMRTLGIQLVAPTPKIAQDAARFRALNVGLADGFALATAAERRASLASFDERVRRALPRAGLALAEAFT
jgi:predicted nucleic acid-binding protein